MADNRPRWDDPDLRLMFTFCQLINGQPVIFRRLVTADEARRMCEISMTCSPQPHWRNDPTYNMRRTKPWQT